MDMKFCLMIWSSFVVSCLTDFFKISLSLLMLLYKGKDFFGMLYKSLLKSLLALFIFFCGNINAIQNRNRNEMMMKKKKQRKSRWY